MSGTTGMISACAGLVNDFMDEPGMGRMQAFPYNHRTRPSLWRRKRSRRASPHCNLVNLVRSGRKQPQLFAASAGGKARHPFGIED
jgi:hypothetical protein